MGFLGANQDSYAEGGGLGHSSANTQNYAFDGQGVQSAYESMSKAMNNMREKMSVHQSARQRQAYKAFDNEDFFEGDKGADLDLQSRMARGKEKSCWFEETALDFKWGCS